MLTRIPGSVEFIFRIIKENDDEIVQPIYAVNKLDAFAQINEMYPEYKELHYTIKNR